MSAFRFYVLRCDAPGCMATCQVGEEQAHVTRKRAADLGWSSRAIKPGVGHQFAWYADFCPEHAGSESGEAPLSAPTRLTRPRTG